MKILILTKRQYTGQDLIDDKFGRLREIPLALARRGHEVYGLCMSYAPRAEGSIRDADDVTNLAVTWESLNAGALKLPGLLRYYRRAAELISEFQPDIIWACSDSLYGIIGTRLARSAQCRAVFDVYDNFEYFGTVAIPGVRKCYRQAVRESSGITCAGSAIESLLEQTCGLERPALVVENAVRKDLFFPRDKASARQELQLPEHARIIGVAGALSRSRGIETVFEGWDALLSQHPDIHLAVAGARDATLRLPTGPNVHDLGMLPLDRVPVLLSAVDVAVVANKNSEFGRYCFPQKLNEIIACKVPFVAAKVGVMQSVLAAKPQFLFEPDDPRDFARAVELQLEERMLVERDVPSWDDQGLRIEQYFQKIVESAG